MQLWEWEQEQDRRETETLRRLHRLKKRGYEIDWKIEEVEEAFFLDHLGEGPDILFYPSGMVVATRPNIAINPTDDEDSDRILNSSKHDIELFDRWLLSVPSPTWWQRGAPDREKYIWQPTFVLLFFLATYGFGALVGYLVDWR